MNEQIEIGVDIGGTFTDVVCRQVGKPLRLMKVPSTRSDPGSAVLKAVARMREEWDLDPASIAAFMHGTTVATNAILEHKGARLGIVTTQGFRDVIEIGRQLRRNLYALEIEPETAGFLAPGRYRREVTERISATGEIITPLDEAAVLAAAKDLVDQGVNAIAVVFLFSFVNPAHETRARDIISAAYPDVAISLSHEVDPCFREYERTVATAFDAYVKPTVERYLENLESGLAQAGVPASLQVMQSRGGLTASPIARQRPVRLFLSGPAAGVVGGQVVGASAGLSNLITIDIGGTSADIALIADGRPMLRSEGLIGQHALRIAMVDVNTIGSGGGSIAWIDAGGALKVGPESAGSEPGPACYDRGGKRPTVTDASVVLGYLSPDKFAGGAMSLSAPLAAEAITSQVAEPLGLSVDEGALGIHRVVNAQMAEGIRLVSVRQGIDPRDFALVPLGGGGGMHATPLARDLGIDTVLVPRIPGVLAAAGLLASPIEHEVTGSLTMPLAQFDPSVLNSALARVDTQAAGLMAAENLGDKSVSTQHFADICYIGQSYSIEVPFEPGEPDLPGQLYARFMAAHDRIYGHATKVPAKITAVRTVCRAGGSESIPEMRFEPKPGAIEIGKSDILVEGTSKRVTATLLDRECMPAGYTFSGPAVLHQRDTTTLVEPGWSGRVDDVGNIILTRTA